jgi:N-acyl-L-homoserine lactone synthetase
MRVEIEGHSRNITIQSDVFQPSDALTYAVGIVAVGRESGVNRQREYVGYLQLRGMTYGLEKAFLEPEDLQPDRSESDADDVRSVHFTILHQKVDGVRVVGAMRLIVKSDSDSRPLPIELHYPRAKFDHFPLLPRSIEVSRLIVRHEDPAVTSKLKWWLFASGLSYARRQQLGPVFGVVEPSLERILRWSGVVVRILGETTYVPHFNSRKMPVQIELNQLERSVEARIPGALNHISMNPRDFFHFVASEINPQV